MFSREFIRMFFLLSQECTEEKGHKANTEIGVGDPLGDQYVLLCFYLYICLYG